MLKAIVVGASGYTGAELATFLTRHPSIELSGLYVSEGSLDKGKKISDLYGNLRGCVDLPLQPLGVSGIKAACENIDIVILATAHEVSHDLAPLFLAENTVVFDLSGAFRVQSAGFYEKYYGFTHQYPELLAQAVYGLAEWNAEQVKNATEQTIALTQDENQIKNKFRPLSIISVQSRAETGIILTLFTSTYIMR